MIDPGSRSNAAAVIVTSPAILAVRVKLVLVPPATMLTAAGKVALPEPLCVSVTASPPAGAGSLEVAVTVVLLPTISVVVGAERTSATGCFTDSAVLVEIVRF